MSVIITKYHGLGNDYLIYDPLKNSMELTPERVRLLCDRHFGIGADGIMFGPVMGEDGISVQIYNPDGSIAEAGGNGVRIFARYLKDCGYVVGNRFSFSTCSGTADIECLDEKSRVMRVSMGTSNFLSSALPVSGDEREVIGESVMLGGIERFVTCLSMGNPHCVIPMENISRQMACEIGEYVAKSESFTGMINTQLMQVRDRRNIDIEIYERGAGYTLASGTSGAAAASAAYRMGLTDNTVSVHMPGGTLEVEIADDGNVFITGSVEGIGTITLSDELEEKLANA